MACNANILHHGKVSECKHALVSLFNLNSFCQDEAKTMTWSHFFPNLRWSPSGSTHHEHPLQGLSEEPADYQRFHRLERSLQQGSWDQRSPASLLPCYSCMNNAPSWVLTITPAKMPHWGVETKNVEKNIWKRQALQLGQNSSGLCLHVAFIILLSKLCALYKPCPWLLKKEGESLSIKWNCSDYLTQLFNSVYFLH